ncbi:MAG TPA: hypothetical protein VEL79_16750, partial [Vicinamibacterales bacterium]|nr:hypothetical protein [Vicinamibacterales bacterium]
VRARQLREQALAVASPSGSRIANTRTLATRARALIALHRLDEARPIVMDLVSRGYRHPSLITDWRAHGGATPQ